MNPDDHLYIAKQYKQTSMLPNTSSMSKNFQPFALIQTLKNYFEQEMVDFDRVYRINTEHCI